MTRSRYILIGDVHGCLVELQAMICRIAPLPDDTFVFLGDLVDKGPDNGEILCLSVDSLYGSLLVSCLSINLNRITMEEKAHDHHSDPDCA